MKSLLANKLRLGRSGCFCHLRRTTRLEKRRLKEPVVIRSVYDLLRDRETH